MCSLLDPKQRVKPKSYPNSEMKEKANVDLIRNSLITERLTMKSDATRFVRIS